MRALTYNLLAGQDDDVARLREATLLLRAAKPDVLVLNEGALLALDEGVRLRELEAALGMHGTLGLARSGYHVALFVRGEPAQHVEVVAGELSHVALVARLRVGRHELQVVGAHLYPFSAEKRLREVELLLTRLDVSLPTLLLGDLNAISPRDVATARPESWVERYRARHLDASGVVDVRALAALERSGLIDVHASHHGETMPTRPTARYATGDRPSQRLDYIFASADLARTATHCAPFEHSSAETASDHRPLYADFAWP
ncbi:MAG TPA: endonuclease/exonuclease/phosphatase family protein [Polyangiales bacterium]|nr:endonuclease/exonuclease/phosphatase family protein [Polyangiales bacterium]